MSTAEKKQKYILEIYGYGQEIVQGTWTDAELKKLTVNIDETDETDLATAVWSAPELLPESEEWFERDDLCHHYGGLSESCGVTLSKCCGEETEYENIWDVDGAAIEFEEVYNYTGKENVLTIISSEKGLIFSGEINLPKDEEFDATKLKFSTLGIMFNTYENELIHRIYYDNVEIENSDGGDTRGKGFFAYLERKESKTKEKEIKETK